MRGDGVKSLSPRTALPVSPELLLKMDVIINVVRAEAVIPFTARAVSELKTGIFRIRSPADGAFVAVLAACLTALHLPRGFFEVNSLL